MKNIVLYHGNCMDGTGAALAHMQAFDQYKPEAERVYQSIDYPNAKTPDAFTRFLDAKNLDDTPINDDERTVWFLDFTPTLETLIYVLDTYKHVIIVDHHPTGAEVIEKLRTYENVAGETTVYENLFYINAESDDLSGSALMALFGEQLASFELFHQSSEVSRVFHRLLGRIGDSVVLTNILGLMSPASQLSEFNNLLRVRDVWDNRDSELKRRADGLNYYCFHNNFQNNPETLGLVDTALGLTNAICDGLVIKSVYEKVVQNAIDDGFQTTVETASGQKINLLVTTCPSSQASLLGEMWYSKFPDQPAISVGMFYGHAREAISFGMRSNDHINCRVLAEHFGGGGHDRAAGGNFSATTFIDLGIEPTWEIPNLLASLNNHLLNKVKELY